jgi:hypothetical protein
MVKGNEDLKDASRKELSLTNETVRSNSVKYHQELSILREQSATVQKAYQKRISELENRLLWLRDKYRTLEKRRNLEVFPCFICHSASSLSSSTFVSLFQFEGYRNDVLSIRRQIEFLENNQYLQRVAEISANDTQVSQSFKTKSKMNHTKNRSKKRG